MELAFIRECIADPVKLADNQFFVFQHVTRLANSDSTVATARDLVIRLLALRSELADGYDTLLDALVRGVGLFPYADRDRYLSLEDQMLLEAHRVTGVGEDRFFHSLQLSVYQELLKGRNVVLSAPTSVGKSLVVDAVLATKMHKRSVVVVPTIALIDETRRRIVSSLGASHDIITHPSQERLDDGRPTVYVLTQERALARRDLNEVDFFVIDEFYKLDLRGENNERAIDLNICFHRLAEQGAQFYLIGPNIASVQGLASEYKHVFMPSAFSTVALDITYYNLKYRGDERADKLVELCNELKTPTLVYCQSPRSARVTASTIYERCALPNCDATKDAVAWLEKHYPSEWEVIQALKRGVGIHHGNVPRAIQQYMVRAFEERRIQFLVCTSTIIEGVNTVAENVVIFDRRLNNTTIDDFTFRNIAGRAGRMNRYFIGKVYVLEEAVPEGEHRVDLPVDRQDAQTPLSLLLDLPATSLTPASKERITAVFEGSMLSEATIRSNRYIPVESQNELFNAVVAKFDQSPSALQWRGVPKAHQLRAVCDLIFDHVDHGNSLRRHGIFGGDQLHAVLTQLMSADSFRAYINDRVSNRFFGTSVSDAVEEALSFLRNYVGYTFGRQLMAVSRVQADVLVRYKGVSPGDYSLLAAQAESLFMPAGLYALDEYGVPAEIATKLQGLWGNVENVDQGLRMLARLDLGRMELDPFERDLLENVRSSLPVRAFVETAQ
ncbi:DEAD/DEAH box helicase [Sphingomonas sp. MMS12-HWE2-04]|uniref:DEAD/DEAH box helicase n=1 Tax=Sphingomonas sp. MMS12-HWE2-04 TaxID=3234199 RepID=UPI003850D0DB